jgi:hypothetical protein
MWCLKFDRQIFKTAPRLFFHDQFWNRKKMVSRFCLEQKIWTVQLWCQMELRKQIIDFPHLSIWFSLEFFFVPSIDFSEFLFLYPQIFRFRCQQKHHQGLNFWNISFSLVLLHIHQNFSNCVFRLKVVPATLKLFCLQWILNSRISKKVDLNYITSCFKITFILIWLL